MPTMTSISPRGTFRASSPARIIAVFDSGEDALVGPAWRKDARILAAPGAFSRDVLYQMCLASYVVVE